MNTHSQNARESMRKYTPFPIKPENFPMFEFYKRQDSSQWPTEDVNFEDDKKDYPNLTDKEKCIYRKFISFFAPSDGLITEQAMNFLKEAQFAEEKMFLISQLANEQVHTETYARAITEVVPETEWEEIFSEIEKVNCMKEKGLFIEKWIDNSDAPRGLRYLAGAFGEGIFFMSLFSLIFYFRRKNKFKNFCTANKFIMRDETLHRNFNAYMAKRLGGFDHSTAYKVAEEAVALELAHMEYILSEPIDSVESDSAAGLTKDALTGYIKTLADQVLFYAGVPPLYKVSVDLPWMSDVGNTTKENFYETVVTKYSKMSVKNALNSGNVETTNELKKTEGEEDDDDEFF